MSESREVKLPEDLCAAAEKRFGARFGSIDELVTFLLRELLSGDTAELDRAEQAAVEQRLKDLGYL
jgi:Arc/MetJ-type ribon-helix-helix transcriptional regulator